MMPSLRSLADALAAMRAQAMQRRLHRTCCTDLSITHHCLSVADLKVAGARTEARQKAIESWPYGSPSLRSWPRSLYPMIYIPSLRWCCRIGLLHFRCLIDTCSETSLTHSAQPKRKELGSVAVLSEVKSKTDDCASYV